MADHVGLCWGGPLDGELRATPAHRHDLVVAVGKDPVVRWSFDDPPMAPAYQYDRYTWELLAFGAVEIGGAWLIAEPPEHRDFQIARITQGVTLMAVLAGWHL